MKKRKIVGICSSVGNKAKATNNTYPIIFINRVFIEISHSYNLIPIILSPTVDISEIEQMANMIDFLILTGGEDIHPQFYNEVINYDYYEYNACNPTLERDYFEIQLYSISKSLGKSILGICRGMQIINISEGGTLCQNIDTYLEHSIRKDGWIPYHSIKIKKNTILHQLLDIEEYTVSSTHHQCIKKLGMNIVASAYSADGIVEAIELCSVNKLVIIDKSMIMKSFPNKWMSNKIKEAFMCENYESTYTSGSTSERMQIVRPKDWWKGEYKRTANYNKYLMQKEINNWKKAILTTAICSNMACYLETPSYEERIIHNTLFLNIHPDPNTWKKTDIERICYEIELFKPLYIDVDPIYLSILLNKISDYGINFQYTPQAISLSYEYCTKNIRKFIESHIKCPIFNLYGSTEIGYILCECECGQMHLCDDLIQVELIPFKNRTDLFSLIVTSLRNPFMPFVNYKTGDIVKATSSNNKCECGLRTPTNIQWVMGREKDIITFGETVMTYGDLDEIVYSLSNNLIFVYQLLLEEKNGNLIFRYTTFNKKDIPQIHKTDFKAKINEYFGTNISVNFIFEQSIRPEISGKFAIIKTI